MSIPSHAALAEVEKGPGDSELQQSHFQLSLFLAPSRGQEMYLVKAVSDNIIESVSDNPLRRNLLLRRPGCQPHPKSWGNLNDIFTSLQNE